MQNKKPLLQRLLVIYITFFIVLVASVAHGILPNFTRGAAEGVEMGNDIAEKWKSGIPRMIYILSDIRSRDSPGTPSQSRPPRAWRSARASNGSG